MTLGDFIDKSRRRYRSHGLRAVPGIAGEFTAEVVSRAIPFHRYGRRIFEYEWDVLLVLDACRADMYRRVINSDANVAWSCAGTSLEWMEKNFHEDYASEMTRTAYVTGNPFTRDRFGTTQDDPRTDELALLDEVWRYAWDDETGTIPAKPLTDRGIAVCREGEFDRVIVHYMQPHFPFIGSDRTWGRMDVENFGEGRGDNVWHLAMLGEADLDEVLAAYDDNLEYVWKAVETVLENVSGEVVISADHGNSIGQWGIWGHRPNVPVPSLRRVPWDRYSCEDERTYDPDSYDKSTDVADGDVEDRLESLGYL